MDFKSTLLGFGWGKRFRRTLRSITREKEFIRNVINTWTDRQRCNNVACSKESSGHNTRDRQNGWVSEDYQGLGGRGRDPLHLLRMERLTTRACSQGEAEKAVENRMWHPFDVGSLPHKLS